jgi:hypothetical protein
MGGWQAFGRDSLESKPAFECRIRVYVLKLRSIFEEEKTVKMADGRLSLGKHW